MRLLASLAFQGSVPRCCRPAPPGWIGGDWKPIPIDGLEGRSVGIAWRRKRRLAAGRAVLDVIRQVVADEAPVSRHPRGDRRRGGYHRTAPVARAARPASLRSA
jgi:hypothetical protein